MHVEEGVGLTQKHSHMLSYYDSYTADLEKSRTTDFGQKTGKQESVRYKE